jgi:hypothetical protein
MKAITIKETQRGRAICETTPRYDVLLHGNLVGQLYFNMTGYTGCYLPCANGAKLNPGECSIASLKRQIAILNREWIQTKAA